MSRPIAEVGSTASSYEILAKLATGGMAEIFLARGASTAGVERYVVLKRVLREKATDVDFLRMFLDEARLAAQLQHPNIAQVYDIGKLGDSYFFTMEYVHGETVRGLLQRAHALRRPLPIATVLTIVAGSAGGLHHAHDRIGTDGRALGIVHRDVSPSNLMASYEGAVKVVDFGVAKAAHRSHETRAGTIKGKIAYLSPEQCRGGEIDRRSDLFALGIVFWEMLTTERLYRRNSDFENMAAIVGEPTSPPSSRRPEIPPELDAIVLRCLEKNPADRFQTADELHEAIESVAVRTGSALSSAALGRLMRELFGQRPEPWIEMQTREAHPEVVTVTSEPLPAQLGVPVGGRWDLELELVRDLGAQQAPEAKATKREGVPHEAIPTAAMHSVGPHEISEPLMTAPVARPAMSENLLTTFPRTPAHGAPVPIQYTPSQGSGVVSTRSRPGVVPATTKPYDISYTYPPVAAPRRVPRIVFILGPAVVIGIIIGIAASFGGGSKRNPGRLATEQDAGLPAVATVMVDAHQMEQPTAQPMTVVVDAAVAVVADPDAAVAEIVKPDPVLKKPRPTPPPVTVDELLKQSKVLDAVTMCAGSANTLAQNSSPCVIAACRAHETAKARKWLASVATAKRGGLVATCKAAGTQLEVVKPKNSTDDCHNDPMACQH